MMGRLRVAAIVEGDGEFDCIRILLCRIWGELLGGEFLEVMQPIRRPQGTLLQEAGLQQAVGYAIKKLKSPSATDDPTLILILIDSEGKCPARLGPKLLKVAAEVNASVDIACVLAHYMYETWFVAAADSLRQYLRFEDADRRADPESAGLGKSWIKRHFHDPKDPDRPYRETRHQPAMTAAMDLNRCRTASPSFDKLCREFEKRLS